MIDSPDCHEDPDEVLIRAMAQMREFDDHIDGIACIIRSCDPSPEDLDAALVNLWHRVEERVIGRMRQ
jgi:hypothetical protein